MAYKKYGERKMRLMDLCRYTTRTCLCDDQGEQTYRYVKRIDGIWEIQLNKTQEVES